MDVTEVSPEVQSPQGRSHQVPWVAITWFGSLLIFCYYPVLARLFRQWMDDPDVGHGVFVPVVAGYIAWIRRDELFSRWQSPNWWGLVLVAYGSLQLLIGAVGAELFLSRTAFVISIAGAILLFGGVGAIRSLSLPLVLLLFMIPIPQIVFNQLTFPLQLLASNVAENALTLAGIPVLREGNVLELPSQTLSVVEACSGIRSLLSLSFLAIVYSFFFDHRPWMRPVLLLAAIPIAIIANASRITITGLLSEYDPELAEGFFHSVEGWVVFLVSLSLLIATHRLILLGVSAIGKLRRP